MSAFNDGADARRQGVSFADHPPINNVGWQYVQAWRKGWRRANKILGEPMKSNRVWTATVEIHDDCIPAPLSECDVEDILKHGMEIPAGVSIKVIHLRDFGDFPDKEVSPK